MTIRSLKFLNYRIPFRIPFRTYTLMSQKNGSNHRALNKDNINPAVVRAEYAVRGELAIRAETLRSELKEGRKHPFKNIVNANIGNPQQLDQQPITFFRQVVSILQYPELLHTKGIFPKDVLDRATLLQKEIGSLGAYSHSQGVPHIRKDVADFIRVRDGDIAADPNDIFLTAGASQGVSQLLQVICASPTTGVLIPIPQYPLYTAALALMNTTPVPYILNEKDHWGTDVPAMHEGVRKARSDGTDVKAVVIINPGNPTGACLSRSEMEAVIDLAASERLVLMADEVYQTNIFKGEFISFKKVLRELQQRDSKYNHVELVSFHSTSKGMLGECGQRGGYFELVGFDPEVVEEIYKLASISLCAPVAGQVFVDLMVKPPQPGDESYDVYEQELKRTNDGLAERSCRLYEAFQRMEGVECQEPQGAMYLFPTINLPQKALEQAKNNGKSPDELYCLQLLDATGICMVAGKGFGQAEGTFHVRTTFLPPGTEWIESIEQFHQEFMKKFA